jgi:hypothetical protein
MVIAYDNRQRFAGWNFRSVPDETAFDHLAKPPCYIGPALE